MIFSGYKPNGAAWRLRSLMAAERFSNHYCTDLHEPQNNFTVFLVFNISIYNRGIQMYRFPNSNVQKSVIFEGIKKRLKIV